MDDVKKNLAAGIARVKWIAQFIAERTRAETSLAKNLYEKSKIESKMDDIYINVGRRVTELSAKGETDILSDSTVQSCLNELKTLKETAAEYKAHAESSGNVPKE